MIDFKHLGHLYHYTSFESAVKIIVSKIMLFSNMDSVNDINEKNGPIVFNTSKNAELRIREILSGYKQISFTTDQVPKRGYDIPAMWGHYAEKGKGVCLVFDKRSLVNYVKGRKTLYSKEVEYFDSLRPDDFQYNEHYGAIEKYIRESKDTLFFHKSNDWRYEQEYRVITLTKNLKSINVKNSLVGAILFSESKDGLLNSVEYKVLSRIEKRLEFFRYSTMLDKGILYHLDGQKVDLANNPIMYDLSIVKGAK